MDDNISANPNSYQDDVKWIKFQEKEDVEDSFKIAHNSHADIHAKVTEQLLHEGNSFKFDEASDLRDLVISLKYEFEKFKKDTQDNTADIESNWKEMATKLEELQEMSEEHSEAWHENDKTMKLQANSKRNTVEEENNEECLEFGVEEDVFSIMMFSPFCSLMYWTGIFTFSFQMFLVVMLYESLWQEAWEEVSAGDYRRTSTFNIPFGVGTFVRIGQYLVALLSIAFQTDIHDAIHYFLLLRKGNTTNWKILADNQASLQEVGDLSIVRSVYIPNLLRLCQGCATLWIVSIIIKKNDDFMDLLMIFSAVYVVSEIDNIIFNLIRRGFCPCFHIVKTAANIEDVKFQHSKKRGTSCCRGSVFNTLNVRSFVLGVSSLYLLLEVARLQWKQDNGDIMREVYPRCHVDTPRWIGDDWCNGGSYNTEECGWDGGDCVVDLYPDCHVDYPHWIGNGMCNV
ncbi:hypothetical protein CTEN210_18168 [Chaetoceros tenuissimus]|uniref:LNR domain-containing protein n=1 Tax=Chaetoceros tenuissimus TaxID=426638 RepID=A0AAD3DBY5_9STRA|nr:hypothetical protein CTEN210_18168 [Chaetoceros tenuissimus]